MGVEAKYSLNEKVVISARKIPINLVLIMVLCVVIIEVFLMSTLYQHHFEHEGDRLYEIVQSRAKIIETVARSHILDDKLDDELVESALDNTLLLIEAAHSQFQGFGKTGEFVIAHKVNDNIEFILDQRHADIDEIDSFRRISIDSNLAVPMRLALEGKSGKTEALDYRGELVLAAYIPIGVHSWGLVAKIDKAEIQEHFIYDTLLITGFTILIAGVASFLFYRRTKPVLNHLNNSEAVHRSIFENAHDAIVMVDQDINIVSVNPEVQKLFGYEEDEIVGESVHVLVPASFRPRHVELVKKAVDTNEQGPMSGVREVWARHKKGHEVPVEISLSRIEVNGKAMFAALMRDISDRKKAEKFQLEIKEELEHRVNERTEELTQKNQRLNKEIEKRQRIETELLVRDRAMAATANGVLITDNTQPDNPVIYVNPGFEKITGYQKEQILGKNCRFLQGGDTEQEGLKDLRSAIKNGEDCKVTIKNYRADGEMFWNQLSISPVFDGKSNISHFIGIQEDITTQKLQAEENQNLALVVENTSNTVVIVDFKGTVQWANDSLNRFMDLDFHNAKAVKITDFGSEIEENKIQISQLKKSIDDQNPIKIEIKLYDLLGKVVWIEQNMQPVFSDYGLEKFIVIGTDITDRKSAEKALLESQERFALVMQGTNDGIWDWNILTDNVYYSPHFFELLNYSKNHRDQGLEFFVNSLVPDVRLYVWEQINRHLESKEPFDEEFQMQTRDGKHRWFRARGQAIWNDEGLPLRMSGSIMDVTERVIAEKKIQRWNEELEQRVEERTDELIKAKETADSANRAKSTFLAAMSHELRTPMNGVVGMVDLLRETELSHDQSKMVHTARDSALGLLTIIDDILDFSKIEAGKLEIEKIPFSLIDSTESVMATLSNNAQNKGIGFELFIDPALPDRVVSDPIRLRQILYNLAG
ncbi:MAG: PAS domain S-box protein, partial [Gammaproteobacteria bacterium]|nr:PAS domain S-box protein [Gammaproteobacteria bacterium]